MKRSVEINKVAWLKTASVLSGNISAAWFILTFVTPNFTNLNNFDSFIVLFRDVAYGIVFMVLTFIFERQIVK